MRVCVCVCGRAGQGGREAQHSNAALHSVITAAVEGASGGRVSGSVVSLLTSRGEVAEVLASPDAGVDLVIPRGGKQLVAAVQNSTRVPVLGHADGICHVYVDQVRSPTPPR